MEALCFSVIADSRGEGKKEGKGRCGDNLLGGV
jgi:hypothetical protein